MYFQRKLYYKLLEWKNKYADSYALLIEGARRVGKSTLVEKFATNEYKAYILIDFANVAPDVLDSFDDIHDLDLFYLRLQAATGKTLIDNDSVIIFDEIQLFPKARQAIKYLVQDGRYHFIETGSLISIKKNVQNILIPSEEMRISMHPMDFEEFCWAIESNTYKLALEVYLSGKPLGQNINRKWMKDYRIYMAVGGMPQAVKAYVQGENFSRIDLVKRTIIDLYENDFKKIDRSGRISAIYRSIPSQLAIDTRRFYLSKATEKRKTNRDEELLYELIDSKTVIPCYNTRDPVVSLSQTKALDTYKLYLADTGLFISLMFIDRPGQVNSIYMKLLSDKLPANLGFLYENAVAQTIASMGHELYYHTWDKEGSDHYYEIDFLLAKEDKISAIEVKSSGLGKFKSLKNFQKKYSKNIDRAIVLSQKDCSRKEGIDFLPIYMANYLDL